MTRKLGLGKRLRLTLNYAPVVVALILAALALTMALDLQENDFVLGAVVFVVVVVFVEGVGRLPSVTVSSSRIEIKNVGASFTVNPATVTGLCFRTLHPGKDQCVALRVGAEQTIPVHPWLDRDLDDVRAEIASICPNLKHEPGVVRQAWRWLSR